MIIVVLFVSLIVWLIVSNLMEEKDDIIRKQTQTITNLELELANTKSSKHVDPKD